MQQDTPQLTESLLEDLLNPAMTPILICQIHGLTLPQLRDLTHSADYQAAIEAIQSINAARTPPIESQLHLQSQSALKDAADLAHQAAHSSIASPGLPGEVSAKRTEGVFSSHLKAIESLRKSATALLRETRPKRRPRALPPRSRPDPIPSPPPNPKPAAGPSQQPHAKSASSSGTPFVIPPLRVSGVHGGTRIHRPRQSHELRDPNLSIRSALLNPPARRAHRKPRKPRYRRL